jgi:hypothetical protein
MNLAPFIRVDGTAFSASCAEILRARGAPVRSCRNSVGLNELDYLNAVFRFQDCGQLEEITLAAPVVTLGVIAVPFSSLRPFVLAHDSKAFERAGFIISPKFGFAFDPQCPSWVTALAAHCIDSWRAL